MKSRSDKMKERERVAATRTNLCDAIPLRTPFIVQFTPTSFCNFKCNYCWQSLPIDVLNQKFTKQVMDIDLFQKAIDGLIQFDEKVKLILLAGLGEPLLHPQIDQMVCYARNSGVAERIDILTNASLLTKEMSDRLIAAKLDRLRISLQGLSTNKYKTVCGVAVDFDRIIANISYFYENRSDTSIYIKIIDSALESGDAERFKDIFSKISDACEVEFISPFTKEIDYSKIINEMKGTFRINGDMNGSKSCPLPFYMVGVHPNGDICPWCTADIATVYGNINQKTIAEIWRSENINNFWKQQLVNRFENDICANCQVPNYNVRIGDSLNGYENMLFERLNKQ